MAYCTHTEVREVATQITPTGSPVAWTNDVLNKLIERASRLFDMECGVDPGFFEAAGNTPAARVFYGSGTNFLQLPPYVAGSLNSTLSYPESYSALEFAERGNSERGAFLVRTEGGILNPGPIGGWYEGVPITVTAIWGFAAPPADVKHAIIKLVIHICRTIDPTMLKLLVLDGQPLFQDRMPKDVTELAKKYRYREAVLV